MTEPIKTSGITGMVRLSFPRLFEPDKDDKGEDRYSCMIAWPKNGSEMDAKTTSEIKACIKAAYASDPKGKLKTKSGAKMDIKSCKLPLKDADSHIQQDGTPFLESFPEFEGHWVLNLGTFRKPGVVDTDKTPITDPARVYAGCFVRVSYNMFCYENNGNKGISAGLNNLQFWKNGEPLGGAASAQSEFDVIEPESLDAASTNVDVDDEDLY